MNASGNGRVIGFHGVWAVGLAVLMLAAGGATPAHAADGSWTNNTGGTWSNSTKWAPVIADGAGFTAWFTNNLATSAKTVTNDTARTIGNVILGDVADGSHGFHLKTFNGSALTFDKGGNSYNAHLTQTNPSAANIIGVPLVLGNALDIVNLDADVFSITNGITGSADLTLKAGAGLITLSTGLINPSGNIVNSSPGPSNVLISAVIGANVTKVIQNSASSKLTLSGGNTFSALTINTGTVIGLTSAYAFGTNTGVITLGDAAGGSADATLQGGFAGPFSNSITVAGVNTGVMTVTNSIATSFNGPVTLNTHGLTLAAGGADLTLGGGITGTGVLTLATSANDIIIQKSPVNFLGTITNSGTGAGLVTISGGVGANVTAITENSTNSALTISTLPLTVNGSGTTLANLNSSGSKVLTLSGGVRGAGDLILNNNSTIAGGITLTTAAITNAGKLINSGTGSGSVTISAIIGTNVTAVVQNSASSLLTLSAGNTFTNLTINTGTVSGTSIASAFGTNTGVITLGDAAGGSAAATLSGGFAGAFSNAILVAGVNTGVMTITNTAASLFNGPVTLNNHGLTLAAGGADLTLGGGITGSGNLTLAASVNDIIIQNSPVNFLGTITNSGTGAGAVTIKGGVGANVTAITENSASSALTLSNLTVNSSGTILANNNASGVAKLTLLGAVQGNGDLILKNNSSVSDGITVPVGRVVTNVGQVINSGAGPGNASILAIIGSNVTAVIQNSTNSLLTLGGVSTFTNGLFIKAGTVKAGTSTNSLGANANVVTIGDTNGANDATLVLTLYADFPQRITIASNNTGMATISAQNNSGLNGAVTLNDHDLTLSAVALASTAGLAIQGGLSGRGNLLLMATDGGAGAGLISFDSFPVDNTGTITNAGPGTGAATIRGGVGSNVTAIVQASTNSALNISSATTAITVNNGGTTLANNSPGDAKLTMAAYVNGTGDLILKNNSAIADGITLQQRDVTNMGRVVNSGVGTNTLISALIKPPVSQVVQDSATSVLVLSGANTYTGGTLISNGTLRVINTTGSGTGTGGVGVNNGGILEGDGTIKGTVTNYSGGIIAPGTNAAAIGTLTVGNLVWNGGGVFHCQVNDIANDALALGHYDHLSVTGALTAVPAGNLVIRMDSMGQTLAFDTNRNYSLQVITCGTTPTLTWSDVTLDTSLFLLNDTGTWSVTNLNKSIWVVYRSSTQAGNNYWRGSGASTNWSTAGNWSLAHVPQPGEGVEFDGFAGANCGAKGVSNNLASLTLASGYTGTVTFVSNAVAGGMDLTLTGDLTVQEGALVFNGDTTAINGGVAGKTNGIGYAIQASNIFVGVGASINADYKGFAADKGPGGRSLGAGSYGGRGGQSAVTNDPGPCYGSATGPTALGSGGSGGAGGGAIKLIAAGTITVNGWLSANGADAGTGMSSGSGGSIWIATGTLAGTGVIAANGGTVGSSGGGGRIDLSGVTNNFAGVIQADGGGLASTRGLAGSILLPQSAGTGLTLNQFVPYTNIAFGNSLTFSNAVITNGVTVSLDANTNQNTFTFTSLTIATNSTVACLGNLLAVNEAAGGTATIPYGQGVTIIATNVTIQAGGTLNADESGYRIGPGAGTFASGDGVYGGLNRTQNGSTNSSGVLTNSTGSTYGPIANVTALGCGSSYGSRGGGAIKLVVSDTLTVEGTISSAGISGLSAGSGGSLWIDCATLQGAGTISADGGNGSVGGFSGSGGRIHILYTSKGGVNPVDNGGVTAYGGGTTLGRKSAAGTILLTDRGAGDLYGTLIVANNLAASNLVTTLLPTNCFAGTPPQVTVDRVMVSGNGVLEIPSNKTLNVVSVFSNSASFLAGTNSTVALVGTSAAFVYGTSNLFYNLESTNVGKVIQFEANGTNSVLGVLTLKNCTLNSTVNGTWWYLGLDPAGSQNVYQVTVKDSNATNGQEIVAVRSTDSGRNIHWRFSNTGTGTAFTIR